MGSNVVPNSDEHGVGATALVRRRGPVASRLRVGGLLAAVTVAMTACGGSDGKAARETPAPGQAAVYLGSADSGALDLGHGGDVNGLAAGNDGSVYVLRGGIKRITPDRSVESVRTNETDHAIGLVALPDGSLVFARDHAVRRLGTDQSVRVIAGVPGKTRAGGDPVPASAGATAFRFGPATVAPFGVRPDGSVLIIDGDVIWALKDSRLTRVYQVPADGSESVRLMPYGADAVDASGTVYVTTAPASGSPRLGDMLAISPDDSVRKVDLPPRVQDISGSPANLTVASIAADAADGVYANVGNADGSYVIHLHAGTAAPIARHTYAVNSTPAEGCDLPRPVDAMKLTCRLPRSMTYRDGNLFLGGEQTYVLQIAVK